jgi:hypothetical protein
MVDVAVNPHVVAELAARLLVITALPPAMSFADNVLTVVAEPIA